MRRLLNGNWEDISLDYHRPVDSYRVQVRMFANLEEIEGTYLIPPRSAKLVWNYLLEVGVVETWRKVISRMQERNRNKKFQSFGIGEISEGPSGGRFSAGEAVVFFAPGFPACVERVVLPEILIDSARPDELSVLEEGQLLHLERAGISLPDSQWWAILRAWSPYSGALLPANLQGEISEALHAYAADIDWRQADRRSQPIPTSTREVRSTLGTFVAPSRKRKRAILFGYGHYAKTNILPNVHASVDVEAVHEIDPTQVPTNWGDVPCWDSSPDVRATEGFDVYFIAGYHHTHAPIASTALRRGSYAVTEKPVVVDRTQLVELLEAMSEAEGGFFACFHKRYSPFNEYAWKDLGCESGEPINYHCVVYEVPLPDLHWYRWPNSKSRLISNGCHWLDHFLFLNRYCEVKSMSVEQAPDGTINCSVTLENGAYFTMVLTDIGSQRIGLQEYIELRAGAVTVKIVNNAKYLAEDSSRVLRRARINKTSPYRLMYRSIAAQIEAGDVGDSLASVRISCGLILDLEDRLGRGTLESRNPASD
jgi:predicted dehydrogenase